jgi:uncharacterized protein
MVEPVVTKPRLRPCPICKKLSDAKYHPFCSNRCAQIDLGKWLGGDYAVPVVEGDDQPDQAED